MYSYTNMYASKLKTMKRKKIPMLPATYKATIDKLTLKHLVFYTLSIYYI